MLSKKDLNETLEEYPDAKEMLRNKARLLLRQDKKREKKESKTEGSLAENARLASKVCNCLSIIPVVCVCVSVCVCNAHNIISLVPRLFLLPQWLDQPARAKMHCRP